MPRRLVALKAGSAPGAGFAPSTSVSESLLLPSDPLLEGQSPHRGPSPKVKAA